MAMKNPLDQRQNKKRNFLKINLAKGFLKK